MWGTIDCSILWFLPFKKYCSYKLIWNTTMFPANILMCLEWRKLDSENWKKIYRNAPLDRSETLSYEECLYKYKRRSTFHDFLSNLLYITGFLGVWFQNSFISRKHFPKIVMHLIFSTLKNRQHMHKST